MTSLPPVPLRSSGAFARRAVPLALALSGLLAAVAPPAWAERPEWAGQGHGQGRGGGHGPKAESERGQGPGGRPGGGDGVSMRVGAYFTAPQRTALQGYFGDQYRAGKCPPGLAKKHNGCMPPGQARKWAVGRPLPRDVVYYPLPQSAVVQIGMPPAGYRYVRVASDILLIAIGTGMVIDALQDLGQL
ncbi:MAG: RcnB family protein [Acidovorax sp.]|nr:RcnB family protein [Acidovorax sp.]